MAKSFSERWDMWCVYKIIDMVELKEVYISLYIMWLYAVEYTYVYQWIPLTLIDHSFNIWKLEETILSNGSKLWTIKQRIVTKLKQLIIL